MAPRVTISVTDGIADVRLNRPDKLNALDTPMVDGILQAGAALSEDRSVRVVVLSGEGRGFCAGLDMASLGAIAGGQGTEPDPEFAEAYDRVTALSGPLTDRLEGRITNMYQEVAYLWSALEVPVLVACHGPVLGAGLQIALGGDIRFTTPDAKWSVLETRWGLLPDMTGLQQLVRVVGLDVAKELSFTGRIVSGEQAGTSGLATHVTDDPHGDAMALASELCARNPAALRGIKSLANAAGFRPLAESFLEESRLITGLIGSPNQIEATMAHLENRPPRFVDP